MKTRPKLSRIWGRIRGVRALVFGDLTLEKYRCLDSDCALEAFADPSAAGDEVRPGGAAAVAALASALGAETAVAGYLGDDSAGRTLSRLLDEAGVDRSLVAVSPEWSTGVVERAVRGANRGEIRVSSPNRSRPPQFSSSLKERLPNGTVAEIANYDLLLVLDDGYGACDRATLDPLFSSASVENVLICVDACTTRDYARYRGATLLKLSRARAQVATGKKIVTGNDALEAGREICRRWGFLMTVITLGCEGMALVEAAGDQLVVPTAPLEIFESSGAREISLATVGICLAKGTCGPDALRLANLAAGLEIQKLGIKPISHQDVYQETLSAERGRAADSRSSSTSRARRDAQKHVTLRQLWRAVAVHREQRRKIVVAMGQFALIDASVVAELERLSGRGDVVIAAILADGEEHEAAAIDPEGFGTDSRARMLATVPWVDYVVILPSRKWNAFVRKLRPDSVLSLDGRSAPHGAAINEGHDGE